MGIVVNGELRTVPGIRVISYLEDESLHLDPEDYRARRETWVRSIVLHQTIGDLPQVVLPGAGAPGGARATIRAQQCDMGHAGQHLVVDYDGTVYCCADLVRDTAYHAKSLNEVSIGIELKQTAKLETYQATYNAAALLVDWITGLTVEGEHISIQRQIQWPYHGEAHPVTRLLAGGRDCVGVFGHRDQTTQRGPGDPGDYIFAELAARGYERLDFQADDDKQLWRMRQRIMVERGCSVQIDGIAGPSTARSLVLSGMRSTALWLARPIDEAMS